MTTTTDTPNDDLPPELSPQLLLSHLRAARLRAQLASVELTTIGLALSSGAIDVDAALARAADVDALRFLLPPPGSEAAT